MDPQSWRSDSETNFGEMLSARFVASNLQTSSPAHQVGGGLHTEWWVPAERLKELNANIVGLVEFVQGLVIAPQRR